VPAAGEHAFGEEQHRFATVERGRDRFDIHAAIRRDREPARARRAQHEAVHEADAVAHDEHAAAPWHAFAPEDAQPVQQADEEGGEDSQHRAGIL
jgi:hypothetical protein